MSPSEHRKGLRNPHPGVLKRDCGCVLREYLHVSGYAGARVSVSV